MVTTALSVPTEKDFALRLSAFLFLHPAKNFASLLGIELNEVEVVELDPSLGIDGVIYVKRKPDQPKRPPWATYLDNLHGSQVAGLETASSSAVLFLRIGEVIIAFSFGYGRYLLNEHELVSDFGIKTALNTLDHDTLRTVDLYSLEQEPIQKRSQAVKSANINTFGVDVSRDVLRAVTGEPVEEIRASGWSTISGGGQQYSFTARVKSYAELVEIGAALIDRHSVDDYQKRFAWVDNIQRVKNPGDIDKLNAALLKDVRATDSKRISLTIPGSSDWSNIFGFSYTNAKAELKPFPSIEDYYAANDPTEHSIQKLKDHRLFVAAVDGNVESHAIYDCLYYEAELDNKLHILFGREWFTIDQKYKERISVQLNEIPLTGTKFPAVKSVEVIAVHKDPAAGGGKSKKKKAKSITLEAEGDYNIRVATELGMHLLDRKLVSADASASPVEVCDLLSNERKFVHVKHRKGYSSGLSHLFAQGRVAAELLLADQNFRKNARKELKGDAKKLIPENKFAASEAEIVFLVLGADEKTVKEDLPFFSKVNLVSTFQSLTERNFQVSICGAGVE